MNHKSLDLIVIVAVTVLAIIATVLGITNVVARSVIMLPFVLLAPGYALTAAVFPRRALGIAEWLLLSFGVSLAVVALGGWLLDMLPYGLQPLSWVLLLGGLVLLACAVAQLRRQNAPPQTVRPRAIAIDAPRVLLVSLTGLVLVAAVAVSVTGTMQQPTEGFTQLWLLPEAQQNAASGPVRLGVRNMEQAPTSYRLQLTAAGQTVQNWQTLTLKPGEQWENTLVLPTDTTVEATLYRADNPQAIYRRVQLQPGWHAKGTTQ